MVKLYMTTVIWGEAFTRTFLDVVLPNQLSQGNLPAVAGRNWVYRFYTTVQAADRITRSAPFARLRRLMPVEIFVMAAGQDALLAGSPYAVMSEFHRHAIADAAADGAHVGFLPPDSLVTTGSLDRLARRVDEGYQAIMAPVPRLSRESACAALLHRFVRPDGTVAVDRDAMVDLMLAHLHPVHRSFIEDACGFANGYPAQTLWRLGASGFLSHCWHMHPVAVKPGTDTRFNTTIDGDFIRHALSGLDRLHVFQDPAEFFMTDLAGPDYGEGTALRRDRGVRSDEEIVFFALHEADPIHHELVRRPGFLCHGLPDPEIVARAAGMVEGWVRRVREAWIDVPRLFSLAELPTGAALWLYGAGTAGQFLGERLRRAGHAVAGFIDSARSGTVAGLPILRLDEYLAVRRDDDVVLIASMYVNEIARNLAAAGVTGTIFDADGLYRRLSAGPDAPLAIERHPAA